MKRDKETESQNKSRAMLTNTAETQGGWHRNGKIQVERFIKMSQTFSMSRSRENASQRGERVGPTSPLPPRQGTQQGDDSASTVRSQKPVAVSLSVLSPQPGADAMYCYMRRDLTDTKLGKQMLPTSKEWADPSQVRLQRTVQTWSLSTAAAAETGGGLTTRSVNEWARTLCKPDSQLTSSGTTTTTKYAVWSLVSTFQEWRQPLRKTTLK